MPAIRQARRQPPQIREEVHITDGQIKESALLPTRTGILA